MKFKTHIPVIGKPKLKQWAKRMISVDVTKMNGFAFVGDFVPINRLIEVKHGEIYLVYGEERRGSCVALVRAEFAFAEEHQWSFVYRAEKLDPAWALQVRDEVASHVNLNYARNSLEEVYGLAIKQHTLEEAGHGIGWGFNYQGEDHWYVEFEEAIQEAVSLVQRQPTEGRLWPDSEGICTRKTGSQGFTFGPMSPMDIFAKVNAYVTLTGHMPYVYLRNHVMAFDAEGKASQIFLVHHSRVLGYYKDHVYVAMNYEATVAIKVICVDSTDIEFQHNPLPCDKLPVSAYWDGGVVNGNNDGHILGH